MDCLCASQHTFFPIYLAVYLYECQLVKLSVCLRNCLSMCMYLCMSDHIGQTIIISAQSNHITKDAQPSFYHCQLHHEKNCIGLANIKTQISRLSYRDLLEFTIFFQCMEASIIILHPWQYIMILVLTRLWSSPSLFIINRSGVM